MPSPKKIADSVVGKASEAVSKVQDRLHASKKKTAETTVSSSSADNLSPKAAVMLMYYLISIDSDITEAEMSQLDEIGPALDPVYPKIKDVFIAECQKQIDKASESEARYDVIQEGADIVLTRLPRSSSFTIPPKLLLWNMLVIANSDKTYAAEERRFLKHAAEMMGIYNSVFLEMETTIQSLAAIESEIEWIKTTDRPYAVIDDMINELEKRKQIIQSNISELVS